MVTGGDVTLALSRLRFSPRTAASNPPRLPWPFQPYIRPLDAAAHHGRDLRVHLRGIGRGVAKLTDALVLLLVPRSWWSLLAPRPPGTARVSSTAGEG
jgi:hypothetical protein